MLAFWRKGSKGLPNPNCRRENQGVPKQNDVESGMCAGPSESPCKGLRMHPKPVHAAHSNLQAF